MPQQAQFDISAARQSGATDDQILGYLAQRSPNFDMQGALRQTSKADVISYLATHATAPEQPKLPSFGEKLTAGYNPGATAFADQPGPASPMERLAVRYLDQLGGAVLGLPSSIYHAVADDPT